MNYIFDEKPSLEDLVQFGVKGMQWGVRNSRTSSSKPPLTAKEKREKIRKRNAKISSVAYTTLGAAYAAVYISSFLRSSGNTRAYAPFPGDSPSRTKSVTDLINSRRNVEVSALKRMHREGHMDSDQLRNFASILNARYDRRVAEALRNS